MNKILIFLFPIFIALSCSKDDNSNSNNGNPSESYLSMKINGVEWKAEGVITSAISSGSFIAVASKKIGDKSQNFSIAFEAVNTSSPNVLNSNSPGSVIFYDTANAVSWSLGNGSIGTGQLIITKFKTIGTVQQASATFSGTTEDSKGNPIIITNGVIFNKLAE